jgi:hypothetical protein
VLAHSVLARGIAWKMRECKKARVSQSNSRLKLLLLAPLFLAGGCTAQVYHPTKSASEMQADVKLCSHQANKEHWFDPVAALYNAYDCLEAKGYRRSHKDFAAQVEQAFGEARREQQGPVRPCAVPCVQAKPHGR